MKKTLTDQEQGELADSWLFTARHNQLPPPGEWRIWFALTGRGWGKNTVGSHFCHAQARANPGRAGFIAARTNADVAKVIIGHPESGLIATQSKDNPCEFKRHLGVVRWANGAYAEVQTSEEPEGGRGPHYAWGFADEIATWKRKPDSEGLTLWDNLQLALRAGPNPQMFCASTPRPVQLIKELLAEVKSGAGVVLSTGTLLDNRAFLPPAYVKYLVQKYKGTRLERQEINGELLNDLENAILTIDMLNEDRVDRVPEMVRIVIGCDPAFTSTKKSDKTGIVVVGRGVDDHCYALENRTFRGTPDQIGKELIRLSYKYDHAEIVPESNGGGDWIKSNILGCVEPGAPKPRVLPRNASQSKAKRAGPILGYHERHEAHLVGDDDPMKALGDQLCLFTALEWEGEGSPDDADAYVHGASELMLGQTVTWAEINEANA